MYLKDERQNITYKQAAIREHNEERMLMSVTSIRHKGLRHIPTANSQAVIVSHLNRSPLYVYRQINNDTSQ